MASNHVSSDQVPLQGQNIYVDPAYSSLFSQSVDRYASQHQQWDPQLSQHPGLAPSPSNQTWHHSPYAQQQFTTQHQPYGAQSQPIQTQSPFQYGQFAQQGSIPNYGQNSNVDPALSIDPNTIRQHQQSPYQTPNQNIPPPQQSRPSSTVTLQAIQPSPLPQQGSHPPTSQFQIPKTTTETFASQPSGSTNNGVPVRPVQNPDYQLPSTRKSGAFSFFDQAALSKATNSVPLNKLLNIGTEPIHLATNRTALPMYTPRLSIKEVKKAGIDNKKLAKLAAARAAQSKAAKVEKKKSASLKRELSDSETTTDSSDDDSEYTSDEEEEESPLPASRPDEPNGAVRYDVIKAAWHPRSSPLSSDNIKKSMGQVWEVWETIQKRWRADSRALVEAEEQKKMGDLPVLKSRVTSQRDLFQAALEAMLEYAHPDVIYHLGQIMPFMYSVYQLLANAIKRKDYDGPLSTALFEVLSRCNTTSERLDDTKVTKALAVLKKHANDKHKALIQKITESAAANSKKAKPGSPASGEAEAKPANSSTDADSRAYVGPPIKKQKLSDVSTNTTKKLAAPTNAVKPTGASATAAVQKRPGEKTTAAAAPIKAKVNQVTNKSSSIFASLNAATKKPTTTTTTPATAKTTSAKPAASAATAKKPATSTSKPAFSFAQTMASLTKPKEEAAAPVKTSEKQLPPETAEEKAKRLRKESRRHLRVTFRPDASLVSIKYFSHEPEEDQGHEENFVRDAGDIGGEGRMFKQHKELDLDDDDDEDEKPWLEPSQVDFSRVEADERQRNYMPFGGGEKVVVSAEKEANIRRENTTLMTVYAHPSDIPSTPREPTEEPTPAIPVTQFGTPSDTTLSRCPQQAKPASPPVTDFSSLENIIKQLNAPAAAQPAPAPVTQPIQAPYVPPPMPAPTVDLQSILSALNGGQNVPQPPAPVQAPPPQQQPQVDFSQLLAMLQANNGGNIPPPPAGLPPQFPGGFQGGFQFPPQLPQHTTSTSAYPQAATAYQAPPMPQFGQPNGANKRPRDDGGSSSADRDRGKRPRNVPHKVLPCRFYAVGKCTKGENCTFIHDPSMLG